MASALSELTWRRWKDSSYTEKDRRNSSDLWASPPPPPLVLIVVVNDVLGTAFAPAEERSWSGIRHPPHGAVLSLVVSSGPGPLATQIRALKSLRLLLLDPPVPFPPPPHDNSVPSVPWRQQGWGLSPESSACHQRHFETDDHPLPPPPPPPPIPYPDWCGGTPMQTSADQASDGDVTWPSDPGTGGFQGGTIGTCWRLRHCLILFKPPPSADFFAVAVAVVVRHR